MKLSTDVGDLWVSTVDLFSLPYEITGAKPYETAVFNGQGRPIHTVRHDDLETAERVHEEIVADIKANAFTANGHDWWTLMPK